MDFIPRLVPAEKYKKMFEVILLYSFTRKSVILDLKNLSRDMRRKRLQDVVEFYHLVTSKLELLRRELGDSILKMALSKNTSARELVEAIPLSFKKLVKAAKKLVDKKGNLRVVEKTDFLSLQSIKGFGSSQFFRDVGKDTKGHINFFF